MLSMKKKFFCFWTIFALFSSICFGLQYPTDGELTSKIYVDPDDIFFKDGRILIVDEDRLLTVKNISQDSKGFYFDVTWIYGVCPNGHPYKGDGGCWGYDCPFN